MKIQAYAVMWSENYIQQICASDNGMIFSPLAIFQNKTEAQAWLEEKWHGTKDGTHPTIEIRKVEIAI